MEEESTIKIEAIFPMIQKNPDKKIPELPVSKGWRIAYSFHSSLKPNFRSGREDSLHLIPLPISLIPRICPGTL